MELQKLDSQYLIIIKKNMVSRVFENAKLYANEKFSIKKKNIVHKSNLERYPMITFFSLYCYIAGFFIACCSYVSDYFTKLIVDLNSGESNPYLVHIISHALS